MADVSRVDNGRVYLDHAATSPLRPETVEAMRPFLEGRFGNPSGIHTTAQAAKRSLEEAREELAALLGAHPHEVVFTGGGTEADNLAVKGVVRAARAAGTGDAVVTTAFEHKGVVASCARMEAEGSSVVRTAVGADGLLEIADLEAALDERTALVSVMLVNNEVGTIQPLSAVARRVRARAPRARLHTDAVQAAAWLDVAVAAASADLVAVSAHKIGGPKGVGVLVVREGIELEPLVEGGGQERGLRSGTSNVMGAVGMAAALRATVRDREATVARVGALRDRLVDGLLAAVPGARENGDRAHKVAGNAHLVFPGAEAEALLVLLDQSGLDAAAGSSCSSGATELSHVLVAMGLAPEVASCSVRFSLGASSNDDDVARALVIVPEAVAKLRAGA